KLAGHALIIADRRLIASGTPAELTASEDPLVRQFMRGQPDGPVPFHYPAPALADELLATGERR
ncbi:MAG TPA: ABC transporter ATP-binding protein, partial [Wenzhouxiangella sp.]|nr:ABC transporter ATP-binding protein [Wenzhouxiangella sp.]